MSELRAVDHLTFITLNTNTVLRMKKLAFVSNHNVPIARSGFTLIELLVTVSVMALLSGLIMINIYGNLAKGRDAKRKNDIRELRTSLELYFSIKGEYPPSDGTWPPAFTSTNGRVEGCGTYLNKQICDWGTPFVQDSITYMAALPKDPKGSQSYFYQRDPTGSLSYIMVTKLERPNDPDLASSQANCNTGFMSSYAYDPTWYVICDAQ
ncbi:prepilin-type N-terminal cleavage/methylation domain-containing protein [Candidatus Microgenomates bacterium]|nr:prepilin-type N-terminal cleavage/methylation domain-containing protein [Candidatus Microgenomates bacterium]